MRPSLAKSRSHPTGLSCGEGFDESAQKPEKRPRGVSVASTTSTTEADKTVQDAVEVESQEEDTGKTTKENASGLKDTWTLWFDKVQHQNPPTKEGEKAKDEDSKQLYDEGYIVELASFSNLMDFWNYWVSLRVERLKVGCNLRVFKSGIRPVAHDVANCTGGKWVIRGVPHEQRSKLWGEMVTMLVSNKVDEYTTLVVNGGVFSTREEGDSLQLWVGGGSAEAKMAETAARLGWIAFKEDAESSPFTFVYQSHQEPAPQAAAGQPPRKQKVPQALQEKVKDGATPASSSSRCSESDDLGGLSPDQLPLSPTEQNRFVREDGTGAPQPGWYVTPTSAEGAQDADSFRMQLSQAADYALPMAIAKKYSGESKDAPGTNTTASTPQQVAQGTPGNASASTLEPLDDALADTSLSKLDEEEDEDGLDGGEELPPQFKVLQDRAKQIRSLKKKIRYINFFLQRQVKGRDLTPAERQKIASLPSFQQELANLNATQLAEMDVQKAVHGEDCLDFLKSQQQPMKFASEEERRYKTIRSLRKKIRFITHHVNRKKEGWVLSHAEAAKVANLPALEAELKRLELEEERWIAKQKAAGNPDPRATGRKNRDGGEDETSQEHRDSVNLQRMIQQQQHQQLQRGGYQGGGPGVQLSPGAHPQQHPGGKGTRAGQGAMPYYKQFAVQNQLHTAPQASMGMGMGHLNGRMLPGMGVDPMGNASPTTQPRYPGGGMHNVQMPQACVPLQPHQLHNAFSQMNPGMGVGNGEYAVTPPAVESPVMPSSPVNHHGGPGYFNNTPYSPSGGPPPLDSPLVSPPMSPLAPMYTRSLHVVGQ